ncbi:hypothetical protein TMO_1140 [Tistrella mobilis KA081020-065]|uniref:Uncharacterized protein n=2 Tax=Tistrella mobilis TaxID=171437 RepID=I3TJP1_TISMK|nr:hypothetical protein TMO_1140 [Tistrella mobilis KA081020-065]
MAEIPAGLPGWAMAPLLIDIVRPQGRDHNLFHIGEEVSTAHSAIQRHGAVISDSPRPPTKVVAFH